MKLRIQASIFSYSLIHYLFVDFESHLKNSIFDFTVQVKESFIDGKLQF